MEIKRFFVDPTVKLAVGDEIEVGGDEFVHAVKVSRYKVGYKLILSNGDGCDYFCTMSAIGKSSFACHVDERKKNDNELTRPLALYLCAIEKSDLAVQKAERAGKYRSE